MREAALIRYDDGSLQVGGKRLPVKKGLNLLFCDSYTEELVVRAINEHSKAVLAVVYTDTDMSGGEEALVELDAITHLPKAPLVFSTALQKLDQVKTDYILKTLSRVRNKKILLSLRPGRKIPDTKANKIHLQLGADAAKLGGLSSLLVNGKKIPIRKGINLLLCDSRVEKLVKKAISENGKAWTDIGKGSSGDKHGLLELSGIVHLTKAPLVFSTALQKLDKRYAAPVFKELSKVKDRRIILSLRPGCEIPDIKANLITLSPMR